MKVVVGWGIVIPMRARVGVERGIEGERPMATVMLSGGGVITPDACLARYP